MRDLRDPQKLGEYLLKTRPRAYAQSGPEKPIGTLSEAMDNLSLEHIEDVSKDDSMCKITQAEYRAELLQRTDKYAKSTLDVLDATGELPKR